MRRFVLITCMLAVFAVVPTHADPPTIPTAYTFTRLDVPGADATFANGLNDRGDIVGTYLDGIYPSHGFLKRGKRFTRLLDVNEATSINRTGDIVGWYVDPKVFFHGFLIQHGGTVPIDVPGALFTQAYGINDADQIIGYFNAYDLDGLGNRGFVRTGSSFSVIAVPGTERTQVTGINNQGVIVGFYVTGATGRSFVTSDGGVTFTFIDVPGAVATGINGINDQGHMIGRYLDAAGAHNFITDGTTLTPIEMAGIRPLSVNLTGLNNRDEIVGYYGDPIGYGYHGFLATPVDR